MQLSYGSKQSKQSEQHTANSRQQKSPDPTRVSERSRIRLIAVHFLLVAYV